MLKVDHGLGGRASGLVLAVALLAAIVAQADPPPADVPIAAEYKEYKWSNGDKPVKMLAKEEGFCFLTEVGGHFAGGGEVVRVYIGEDGFWYLGGNSGQADLWGKAMSVKFTHKIKAAMAVPEDRNAAAWPATLTKLAGSDDPAIKAVAAREQAGLPDDSEKLVALAGDWESSTRSLPVEQRRGIESHLIHLCDVAMANIEGAAPDAAKTKVNDIRIAVANRQLDDLAEWTKRQGDWLQTASGRIRGSGNSTLEFNLPLPADCTIEWRMRILDGMRPRALFNGTDAFVGNEGFDHVIGIYGVEQYRGIMTPYENGQDLKIAVKFAGKAIEFYVNDELMSKCQRRLVPGKIIFALRGGDDWSPGVTEFWDLKISAAK